MQPIRSASPARLLENSPGERAADRAADAALDPRLPAVVIGPRSAPAASDAGSGQRLPDGERAFFEARFGWDFRNVRIHADGESSWRAAALGARAFTYGASIFLGADQPAPGTPAGRRLLAHELAHVTQGGPAIQCKAGNDKPLDPQPVVEHRGGSDIVTVRGLELAVIRARSGALKPAGGASGGYQKLATPFSRAGVSVSLSYAISVPYENAPEDLQVSQGSGQSLLQQRFPSVQFQVMPRTQAAAAAPDPNAATAMDKLVEREQGGKGTFANALQQDQAPRTNSPPSAKGLIEAFGRISLIQLRNTVNIYQWHSFDEMMAFVDEYIAAARADRYAARRVPAMEAWRTRLLAEYQAAQARYAEDWYDRGLRKGQQLSDSIHAKTEHDGKSYAGGYYAPGLVPWAMVGDDIKEGSVVLTEAAPVAVAAIAVPELGMALGLFQMSQAKDDRDPNLFFGIMGFTGSAAARQPGASAPAEPRELPARAPEPPAARAPAPPPEPAPVQVPTPAPRPAVPPLPRRPPLSEDVSPGRPLPRPGETGDVPAPRRSPTDKRWGNRPAYSRPIDRVPPRAASEEPATPKAPEEKAAPAHEPVVPTKPAGEPRSYRPGFEGQTGIEGDLSRGGVLRFKVSTDPLLRGKGIAEKNFDKMIEYFEAHNGKGCVKKIEGNWFEGGDASSNIDSFNGELLKDPKLTLEGAALKTFTGNMAQKLGLTKVSLPVKVPADGANQLEPRQFKHVEPVFSPD